MNVSEFTRENGIAVGVRGFAASRNELLRLTRKRYYAALATSTPDGLPEVATLRYAVTDQFELVMGTLRTSRKYQNLRSNPNVALAIWDDDFSIQIEGKFDEPLGTEEERLQSFFAAEFPHEARLRAGRPNHLFFGITPVWARYTDLTDEPPPVLTLDFVAKTEARETWPVVDSRATNYD